MYIHTYTYIHTYIHTYTHVYMRSTYIRDFEVASGNLGAPTPRAGLLSGGTTCHYYYYCFSSSSSSSNHSSISICIISTSLTHVFFKVANNAANSIGRIRRLPPWKTNE